MIPLVIPMVGPAEAEAAAEVVLSGWLTQGPEVAAFEAEFAALVDAPHACAVSNCTVALHLALMALGVGEGDEVVTVSHTFIASANAIRQCGATPVFVDILPETFTMDPSAVAAAITSRTRAILCVHQMGMPCDLAELLPIARAYGLPLIEDAACAIGSEIRSGDRWHPIGAPHGDIACFSLHPRKVLTVGDGGVITTRNPEWDRLFRLWRQHGMSIPDAARHQSARVVVEDYPTIGFNYRLTDVQAAIGRQQLKRLPWIIQRRRELADNYRQLLQDIAGLRPPAEPHWARSNWQSYCVRLPARVRQRDVMQAMLDRQIATRRGIMCIHMEPAYADLPRRVPLPVSEQARDQCVLLPLFPQMTAEMQEEVTASLREVLS
ncbi:MULTISPECIES: DegT/DnrJ/EryC1/StrS family aminotransferase [unclassified Chelatococcus]|uniref:DegT/DnrJ/EryC1/StrS family aminotransferase n=1 Tax=unclassified Chelatococcus TaxID=2638111 RepID=UPI001BCF7C64|nr:MULTISPECIES: DegT/DnrJ/EryC1/StrS family aminotransferase [unclassified Chelatococcus]MBS7695921.1 DegT/DnrJ/EryC1/StrS family aminotransferase [Chelatococcus sp. YT9]MBX3555704.1 DegT/DnrJ/EryC1/StrS family aminotransferase [Chelatococcus sp.]